MKTFENENYYQILQVPTNAGPEQIKRAYRDALAIYEEESAVTYSLFTDEQRETLLQAIEKAFGTLVDESKRAAYNQALIDAGKLDAATLSKEARRKPVAHSDIHSTSNEKSLSQWVQKKIHAPEIRQLIEQIVSNDLLSGQQLKQLREAYGIEIPEIYTITKISGDTLRMIEADQYKDLPAGIYLKQFLKAYAEILQIDSLHVVESYLKLMAQNTTPP